MILQSV